MSPSGAELRDRWVKFWPDQLPQGEYLNVSRDRQIRFHSLPESKQFAETPAEAAEILSRHDVLLSVLAGSDTTELYVATEKATRSPSLRPMQDLLANLLEWEFWLTAPHDQGNDEFPLWVHLYVARIQSASDALHQLLERVAEEKEFGVVVFDGSMQWLYQPYAGGCDVVARTPAERDELAKAFRTWLPVPTGRNDAPIDV